MAGVTDHIGRLMTVVALVIGVPAGLAALELGWWGVAVAVGVGVTLTLGEGAFRASEDLREAVERNQAKEADERAIPPWLRENLGRRMTLGQMMFFEID